MSPGRSPPPWLFLFSGTAYGVSGAFAAQIMPFAARKHGIELDAIGWFVTLSLFPAVLQFLYAPIVDVGPARRHWLLITAAGSGSCLIAALAMPLPEHLGAFMVFNVLAQIFGALTGATVGGLIAVTVPDEQRGAASAWHNVGNLSGGGLSGAVGIWLLGHDYPPIVAGFAVAAIAILPATALLGLDEPADDHIKSLSSVLRATTRDVRDVIFSRAGVTGLLLCLSPVGSAALVNYFAGMAADYKASANLVALVSGLGSVGLTALGALIGGYLCDRYNRRLLYLISGGLTAACAFAMAAGPRSPLTFAVGATLYNLVTGFCYSTFTAMVVETIGSGGQAIGTRYAMFQSAGNLAIAYVGFVDTRFQPVERTIAADGVLNLGGVAILALIFWRLGSFGKRATGRA